MTKPSILIHNATTDEVITREMTDAEFKEYSDLVAENAKAKETAEALETAKAEALAKLTALGIDPKALGL